MLRPALVKKTLEGHIHYVNSIAFSPDGKVLASGSGDYNGDYTIRLWDVENRNRLRQTLVVEDRTHSVNSIAFSPDGNLLALGSEDWDGQAVGC